MALLGSTALTYADWAKRLDPDGSTAAVVEMLDEMNDITQDAAVVQGNLPTGHQTTVRTGLPSATWRLLNYGVQPSKSTTKQVTDSCGMLEAYSQVDKSLADLNGNTAAFRMSEDAPFVEAMTQEFADTFWYGNEGTAPAKFTGMSPRYNATSGFDSSKNVVSAGGSANRCSIWLIVWHDQKIHLTFPKGSKAGLSREDKGQQTLTDAAGGMYEGYRTHYKWDVGLVVRDWRYAARVCNINGSDLQTAADPADITRFLLTAKARVFGKGGIAGRAAWYAHPNIVAALEWLFLKKSANTLTYERLQNGTEIPRLLGIPLRKSEALYDGVGNAEAAVS